MMWYYIVLEGHNPVMQRCDSSNPKILNAVFCRQESLSFNEIAFSALM